MVHVKPLSVSDTRGKASGYLRLFEPTQDELEKWSVVYDGRIKPEATTDEAWIALVAHWVSGSVRDSSINYSKPRASPQGP